MPLMPSGREWTVNDLDRLPEGDGLRYELLDGMLLVTPAPVPVHQRAVGHIYLALHDVTPAGHETFLAPLDWRPDHRTSLQPDVLICRSEDEAEKYLAGVLLLAVEVLSPSTRRVDLLSKRSKYEDAGVAHWIVDPDEPSIVTYDLRSGHYVEAGRAVGDESLHISAPLEVTLVPSALVTP